MKIIAAAAPDPNDDENDNPIERECQRLRGMSDDELGREWGTELSASAAHFIKLGAIVRVMEERGRDLSELKIGMIDYLRKIAYGQLLPNVLADYGHKPLLLRRLSELPVPDQKRLVDIGAEVGIHGDGGAIDRVRIPLADMTPVQIRTVFSAGHVRTPEEQIRWTRFQRAEPATPVAPRPPYLIGKSGLEVNSPVLLSKADLAPIVKSMFTAADLKRMLRELAA